jgi:DNA repair ATPase RecN
VTFTALRVRNYQSIAAADLKLGDVTILVGNSDSGKSAALRALRDLFFNSSDSSAITAGEERAEVSLAFLDRNPLSSASHGVAWERGNDGSKYSIDGRDLGKPGSTVPEQVVEATRIRELEVGDLAVRLNVAEQDDPWFLLGRPAWSPAAVTKVIGRVAGLDALVLANRDLELEAKRERATAKEAGARATSLRAELAKHDGLDARLELLAAARLADKLARSLRSNLELAQSLLRTMAGARDARLTAQEATGPLREAVGRAEALDLDGLNLRLWDARRAGTDFLTAEENVRRAEIRTGFAREKVEAERAALLRLSPEGLTCATCGSSIHADCLENLRQAASA